MPTILEQQQRLEMEVLATTGYVAILRSHLHQIKDEIAREVKGIQAAYEVRLESAGGKADALHRLSRRLEVQRELDSLIQRYETLKYEIDKLLEDMERATANMEAITGRMAEGARAMWR
jgi:chromosome segregation ATPase